MQTGSWESSQLACPCFQNTEIIVVVWVVKNIMMMMDMTLRELLEIRNYVRVFKGFNLAKL